MSITQQEMEQLADLIVKKLESDDCQLRHYFEQSIKAADDVFLMKRVEDIAYFNQVHLTGPPPRYQPNPTAMEAGNPLIFKSYTFIPKTVREGEKYPLLVLPHGGVHANFNSKSATVVRELIAQGYIVIAPDYRGSTGYGKDFYQHIDYGGLEVEDTKAARDYMVETCEFVDPERVGILGWSHGGMHTLLNLFRHPDSYRAAYASVPVSDLILRLGYKPERYRKLFEAEYHIGKSVNENIKEYQRRSPAWTATKLGTPLLIHTTENDHDVSVLEVKHIIKSLIEAGNKVGEDFWYKVFPPTPGDHTFNRLDSAFAMGARGEAYDFLAQRLSPAGENPLKKYIGAPNPLDEAAD